MGEVMTQHSASGDIDASLALLWQMHDKPTRGRKPGITLEAIVSAAVEIADAEGLEAVSMRHVAGKLGVGTMSLYRHVPGKAELLDLMLDNVNDCPDDDALDGMGWREHLATCARAMYELYLDHPWLLQVDQSRPLLGPNALAGLEMFLRGMRDMNLTDPERIMVLTAIDGYLTGIARSHVNSRSAPERTGQTDEEFWAAQVPVLEKAMATGNYPTMTALSEDAFSAGWEETFELGLTALLDGLERLVADRGT
jgi:AcrR family transcriptional regulator